MTGEANDRDVIVAEAVRDVTHACAQLATRSRVRTRSSEEGI